MQVQSVGIVGAGIMGRGVAELAAAHGLDVVVVDKSQQVLAEAWTALDHGLSHQIERWSLTEAEKRMILGRIRMSAHLGDLSGADWVVECIVEELEGKRALFRELDQICRPGIVLASNTSTLSITEMAAATRRPERVIGTHFLNPATRTRVVEVVRGLETSEATYQEVQQLVTDLGKTPVEVYESPGYITTRLILPLINEAMAALMEGVATAEGIDTAMRLGYEFRYGPLEMADRIGLDLLLVRMERLWRDYGELKYRPHPLLRKLVRAGHLGVRSGRGFFHYNTDGERIPTRDQPEVTAP